MDERDPKMIKKELFSLMTGTIYVVLGGLQIAAGAGLSGRWSELLLLGGGVTDGLILILIGAVLLQGQRELGQGQREGVAFLYMGIALALFFLFLELAEIGASYLGLALIGGPDYEGYNPIETMTPALYLSPLALLGLYAWRSGFTLVPKGVPGNGVKALNNVKEG